MRLFSPLRQRQVLLLWVGQTLSSIGDELNRIGTVWLAATFLGPYAGYVSALQALMSFVSSAFGDALAERWSRGGR